MLRQTPLVNRTATELEKYLGELTSRIQMLESQVGALQDKLEPILMPPTPIAASPKEICVQGPNCSLFAQLEDRFAHLRLVEEKVANILERVAI